MAGLRRKLRLAVNLYETTNSNRIKTGDPLSAYVYPSGAQINETETVPLSGVEKVTCLGRGSITPGSAQVVILRPSGGGWVEQYGSGGTLICTAIEELAAAPGQFEFQLANTDSTDVDVQPGDRIAARRVSANLVTIYEDESDNSNTLTNDPIDVPVDGMVEGYVEERGVDVYLVGDTITDDWYAFNVPAGGGLALRDLPVEVKTEATTVNVDSDSTIISMTPGTGPTATIEHCAVGRILIVVPNGAGVQVATVNTKADNTIYEAAGRTIDLNADEALILVGTEGASADIAYWVPVNTVSIANLTLDDLANVSEAGAADGEVLRYNGASWVSSDEVGALADPLEGVFVRNGGGGIDGLVIGDAGGFTAQFTVGSLTANRIFGFPDANTNLVGTVGAQDIRSAKRFVAEPGGGFQLGATTGYTEIVQFDLTGITAATTRVCTFPDKSGTFAMTSDLKTNVNSLDDVTITGVATSDMLVYNGSVWVNSRVLGSTSASLLAAWIDATGSGDGLKLAGASGFDATFREGASFSGLTSADATYTLPARSLGGTLQLDNNNLRHITVQLPFDGSSTGLFNNLSNINGILLARMNEDTAWADGSLIALNKINFQWIFDATEVVASPLQLIIYVHSAFPTTNTQPPAGTAMHTIPITVPSSTFSQAVTYDCWETDAISYNVGIGGGWMFLGDNGSGSGVPTGSGMLILDIEYIHTLGRINGSTELY